MTGPGVRLDPLGVRRWTPVSWIYGNLVSCEVDEWDITAFLHQMTSTHILWSDLWLCICAYRVSVWL